MTDRRFFIKRGYRTLLVLIVLVCCVIPAFAASNSDIRELLVATTVRVDNVDEDGEVYSFGSGFFIAENGLICTNFHVIEDHFREGLSLKVQTNDGYTLDAKPIVWNYTRDWAVIQIPDYYSERYLDLEPDAGLLDEIWASGYPVTGNLKITEGTISSYQPDFMGSGQNFYDVSMKFDGGNSGGPVINEYLEVVGIVVAYYTEARDMDFIIPMHEIIDELYWARHITGSFAYVPEYVSGVAWGQGEDDIFYVTNETGYEFKYLYIMDDDMIYTDDLGQDFLGMASLPDGNWASIDPDYYPYIQDQIDELFGVLTIMAVDYDGDYYIREWYPDLDSWDIVLTFDDYISGDESQAEEIVLEEGYLRVSNMTGYDFEYLFVVDEQMFYSGDFGESMLGFFYLYNEMDIYLNTADYPWIKDGAQDLYALMYIVGLDTEGDYYVRYWYPGIDSWNVVMDFSDYVGSL